MSFLAIIFLLFIVLVVVLPLSMIQRVWRNWRNMRDMYNYARRQQYPYGDNAYGQQNHRQQRRKKKIFDSNEGEYVDFEEIQVTRTDTGTGVVYDSEEQVSDAEWTEIK